MGKGSSGKKPNAAAKRNRAMYQAQDRRSRNKIRKARKEVRRNEKLLIKGKGPLVRK